MAALIRLIQNNVPVVFTGELPTGGSQNGGGFEELLEELRASSNTAICENDLVEYLNYVGVTEIKTAAPEPSLRVLHYIKDGTPLYFFTNESRDQVIRTSVQLQEVGVPSGYDAFANQAFALPYTASEDGVTVELELGPYESLFVLFLPDNAIQLTGRLRPTDLHNALEISGPWQVASAVAPEMLFKPEARVTGLGNVARPGLLPRFSGTLRYQVSFEVPATAGPALLDLGEVYELAAVTLNGQSLGARICPPYTFEATGLLQEGRNELQIDVTNTLAKAWGSQNIFDRSMPQEPSGLIGPVRLLH
jgi:hypothetical protein